MVKTNKKQKVDKVDSVFCIELLCDLAEMFDDLALENKTKEPSITFEQFKKLVEHIENYTGEKLDCYLKGSFND